MKRCTWVPKDKEFYIKYHDKEWGVPVHNDRRLFELLILEGAQSGLSWEIILKKRDDYRKAFDNFDYNKIVGYTPRKMKALMEDEGIVRNKLKIESVVINAKAVLKVRDEFGTLDKYFWSFVDGEPIINRFKNIKEIPASSYLSDEISKDLKKRGFKFVGSTIIYAFMQAMGMVNDHEVGCFRHKEVIQKEVIKEE